MGVREMGSRGGETGQCVFMYICEIVKERTNLIVNCFVTERKLGEMVCSCDLSAGEVEMGRGSLELNCPPALPNDLISEPRVSSYSASTRKVGSTEIRTVEAFE